MGICCATPPDNRVADAIKDTKNMTEDEIQGVAGKMAKFYMKKYDLTRTGTLNEEEAKDLCNNLSKTMIEQSVSNMTSK